MSPVQTLLVVSDLGGRLCVEGDKLRMSLPAETLPDVKDSIRQNKTALLRLLNSTLLIVKSHVLNDIVLFVSDDDTKQLLVTYGAPPPIIYTWAELEVLVNKRITSDELRRFHEAKRRFDGTLTQ
jgi:hypothetical protein